MYSISFAADEHYGTPCVPGTSVSYENAKQVFDSRADVALRRKLFSLFAFNSSAATVYLALIDSGDAGVTVNRVACILPIFQGSFVSRAIHGGERFEKGLYLKAYTDLQLTAAAGNVLFYEIDYSAY